MTDILSALCVGVRSALVTAFCRALTASGDLSSQGIKQMARVSTTVQKHLRNKLRPGSQLSAIGLLADLMWCGASQRCWVRTADCVHASIMPDSAMGRLVSLTVVALSAGGHIKAFVQTSVSLITSRAGAV